MTFKELYHHPKKIIFHNNYCNEYSFPNHFLTKSKITQTSLRVFLNSNSFHFLQNSKGIDLDVKDRPRDIPQKQNN